MPRLTHAIITRANAPADTDRFYWDEQIPGFGLRCRYGHKSYVLQYRPLGGRGTRQRRLTLGRVGALSLEDARHLAQEYLRQVRYGHDPAADRQTSRQAPTVAQLAERYLSEYAATKKKASSAEHDASNMRLHVLPALGGLQVQAVSQADIARLHHAMRATPYAANRVLSLLSMMFRLAEKPWGLRPPGSNPVRGLERYPEKARERFLTPAELGRLGAVLDQAAYERTERPSMLALIRVLILTGARLGEVLGLEWEHIDWQGGQYRVPDSKSGVKTLYLAPPALDVLASIAREGDNPWCIAGKVLGKPLANPHKPWRRLRTQAGLSDVRLHDLRHTYASAAARAGFSLPMIGALLGHQNASTTARYAHLVDDPVQQAAQVVGGTLSQAIGGR